MDSAEYSLSARACDTQFSVSHLATGFPPEPLNFFTHSFRRNFLPYPQHQKLGCMCSLPQSRAAGNTHTKFFHKRGLYTWKKTNKTTHKTPTKTPKSKDPSVLSCQPLRNPSSYIYWALTSFPRAATWSGPGWTTTMLPPHRRAASQSCPSTAAAAAWRDSAGTRNRLSPHTSLRKWRQPGARRFQAGPFSRSEQAASSSLRWERQGQETGVINRAGEEKTIPAHGKFKILKQGLFLQKHNTVQ